MKLVFKKGVRVSLVFDKMWQKYGIDLSQQYNEKTHTLTPTNKPYQPLSEWLAIRDLVEMHLLEIIEDE